MASTSGGMGIAMGISNGSGGGGGGLYQRGVGHGGHNSSSGKGGQGMDSRRSSFDVEDALDIDDVELMEGPLVGDKPSIPPSSLQSDSFLH